MTREFISPTPAPAPQPVKGAALLYTLIALPLGIIYFVIVVTGLSLSAGLMPIFIGLPLLLGVMMAVRGLLRFERSMALWVLGESEQAQSFAGDGPSLEEGFFARLTASLTDIRTYKGIVFMLLKLPLGIINFTVTVVFASVSLAFIVSPIVYIVIWETLGINIFEHNVLHYFISADITPIQESLIYCVLGFFVGIIAVKVIRLMAELTARLTLLASE